MSQKLLFIFNPHSGKGQIKNNLVEIIDTMVKADFEVTVYTTQAQGDAIQCGHNLQLLQPLFVWHPERYGQICGGSGGRSSVSVRYRRFQ